MKTYYDILHISETASVEIVSVAYKGLSKIYDLNGSEPSEKLMNQIQKAYACLSDSERRKKYDEKLQQIKMQNETKQQNTESSPKSKTQSTQTNTSDSTQETEVKSKSLYEQNKSAIWGWCVAIVVGFIILIIATALTWTKTDVAEHKETFHDETYDTGAYNIVGTGNQICTANGDDYLSCVNSHVSMYNSVCVGKSLTSSGRSTCDAISKFIDDVKSRYNGCGYGCTTTGSGKWGWDYQRAEPETATKKVSNNDYIPAKTHQATCYLGFIGECKN